jgi:hypothetical protein
MGESPDPRLEYLNPSSVVQYFSSLAENLHSELPRSTSLLNINQPVPTQSNSFVSRFLVTVVPPPQPMPYQEIPPTLLVSVITITGENVRSRESPVLVIPEILTEHTAFSYPLQVGARAPKKLVFSMA